MSRYDRCPKCGHIPHGLTVVYLNIYHGEAGKTRFCHTYLGANEGRRCPECGSEKNPKLGNPESPDPLKLNSRIIMEPSSSPANQGSSF